MYLGGSAIELTSAKSKAPKRDERDLHLSPRHRAVHHRCLALAERDELSAAQITLHSIPLPDTTAHCDVDAGRSALQRAESDTDIELCAQVVEWWWCVRERFGERAKREVTNLSVRVSEALGTHRASEDDCLPKRSELRGLAQERGALDQRVRAVRHNNATLRSCEANREQCSAIRRRDLGRVLLERYFHVACNPVQRKICNNPLHRRRAELKRVPTVQPRVVLVNRSAATDEEVFLHFNLNFNDAQLLEVQVYLKYNLYKFVLKKPTGA